MNNVNLDKIKLIIWDLDETLWKGTLSEGTVDFPESNKDLIIKLSKRGIMSSICSKNNFEDVKNAIGTDLLYYFIFPSINWESKGNRISDIISKCQLRNTNVLFVDDNVHNLAEVEYSNPGIMVSLPEIIETIKDKIDDIGKDDFEFSRLKQYKILEKKDSTKKNYKNDDEFLLSSEINIMLGFDCENQFERIYELLYRTNQLNYTKQRPTKEEFKELLINKEIQNAYICAKDKFGEYGLVGFYSLDVKRNKLLNFSFSCRTMGMHIEQFVYQTLGFPEIEVIEPVTIHLSSNSNIEYIKMVDSFFEVSELENPKNPSILMKGPCDLESVAFYIGENLIEKEFRYVNKKNDSVYNGSHIGILENIIKGTNSQNILFCDPDVYKTSLFNGSHDVVVLSTLVNSQLGEYVDKKTGEITAFGDWAFDATSKENFNKFLNHEIWNDFNSLTFEDYEDFSKKYFYLGRRDPIENARRYIKIVEKITKNSKLCFILGSEIEAPFERMESLKGSSVYFKKFNSEMINLFSNNPNVHFINVTDFIKNGMSFNDSLNHFSRDIYYKIAEEIMITYGNANSSLKRKPLFNFSFRNYIRKIFKKRKGE